MLQAAAPGSSIADATTSIPQPAAVQEAAQQHQPHLQQQRQRTARSSLHQRLLYEMPPAGEPLPPLPRFRPRTPEQQPMPVLEALQFVQVRCCPDRHPLTAVVLDSQRASCVC